MQDAGTASFNTTEEQVPGCKPDASPPARASMPLAIVGMSGRYPKADNLGQLWTNLKSGLDAISEAKGDRWDLGFHVAESDQPNRVYTRCGGFLDRIDMFDAEFFGMSPREVTHVDPQHRLLLELTWEALESSGIRPSALAGSKTGVFVGISNPDYATLSAQTVNAYSNIGSAMSIASNRISYIFDLHGPSMSIDTACSSSLVAMHQACNAIQAGDCSMAIVGGVNILASIRPWIGFAEASMLSPDGRCKSFDADGKGYVRAEGGGIVIVKPLADAERDGDEVLGVIVATGVNSDGRTMGMALPSGEAQEALLREVYDRAGIAASDVFYVEAHGTGTAAGDPIECGAIGRVLGAPRDGEPCYMGSIKSNIGHLESGAAIAGLTKLLLSIKHREIPANLHFTTPNPKIDFEGWKLKVVDKALPLPDAAEPLIFGINSFGFGGTNAHMVLREYKPARATVAPPPEPAKDGERWDDVLLLSARSQAALADMAASWATHLDTLPQERWDDLRATAGLMRDQQLHRLVVSGSREDAIARLRAASAGEAPAMTAKARTAAQAATVALVFSGNGPQWWGMGRELLAQSRIFRAKLEEIDAIFAPLAGWSLIEMMAKPEAEIAIGRTEIAQPMLFAQQVALTAILTAAGVEPKLAFGHSVGEVAAAHAAGALSLADATRVIVERSRLQARTAGLGRMAAVGLGPEAAASAIAAVPGWLEIAAVNSPKAVTVAGDPSSLETLRDQLTDEGHFVRVLPLDYPFHTRAMDVIHGDVIAQLADLVPQASTIPFVSTVEGTIVAGETLDAAYWWRNIREPVRFADAVAHALHAHQVDAFIEVGPHPVLKDYILQCVKATENPVAVALTTLRRPTPAKPSPDMDTLKTAVAAMHAAGAIRPEAVFQPPVQRAELPLYPWRRERFWRGGTVLPESFEPMLRDHPLLGARTPGDGGLWTNTLQTTLLPYLDDHVVQGARLFPAAGYIEMSLAAAGLIHGDSAIECETFEILKPLVIASRGEPIAQVTVDPADGTLSIRSRPSIDMAEWTGHVRGRITRVETPPPVSLDVPALEAMLSVMMSGADHYAGCDRRGLTYGPAFQGVRGVRMTAPDAKARIALGDIRLPALDAAALHGYRAHPSLVDSCLQVLISLIGQNDPRDCATIPVQVARVRSYQPLSHDILCRVTLVSESERAGTADIVVTDRAGTVLLTLEGARFQKVAFKSSALPLLTEGWRIDHTWPCTMATPIALPSADDLAAAAERFAPPATDALLGIEALAAAHAVHALHRLGAAGTPFTVAGFARKAGIAPDQIPFLERLLEIAAADGYLAKRKGLWTWVEGREPPSRDPWFRSLMERHPAHVAELMALSRAGETIAARLTGEIAPAIAMRETLEDSSPFRHGINRMAASVTRALVAAWPASQPVRVVEFGTGTGGLAAHVLPFLPATPCDYLAIDASEELLARARNRFTAFPAFRTATPETAATQTGFGLALAAVEPGADDLAHVASAMRDRLRPGGRAVVVAGHGSAFASIVFAGEEPANRVDASDMEAALAAVGFENIRVLGDGAAPALHSLIIAERPAMEADATGLVACDGKRRALIVTAAGAMSSFVTALTAALGGAAAVRLCLIGEDDLTDAAMLALVRDASDVSEFVHLAGWPSSDADTTGALLSASPLCLSAILLGRAIETVAAEREDGALPVLTLVSRGGLAGPASPAPLDPLQAGLAGIGRVMANEQGSLGARLIDVPASPADTVAAMLLAEALTRRDGETEVQLVDGQRWVNRVRATTLAAEVAAARSLPAVPGASAKGTAIKLDFLPYGGLDSLHLTALDRRAPADDEVEIRVQAAGLNFRDVLWAMGMLPEDAVEHGFSGPSIGMECAGDVVRVGAGVTHLKPGDRVIAFASSCFASHVTTKAAPVARMPEHFSYAEAATIPTTFVTAWYALDHLARLEPGETVLIHGAAGGVGLAALQIAKLKGAVVIGTAGSEDKQRLVKAMGATHVLSSRSLRFADDVMALTGGKGVDIVLNSLAGEAITKGLQVLKPFGRFLEIGKRDLYANSRIGLRPFRQNLSYFGIDADTLLVERPVLAKRVFDAVVAAMAARDLKPLPHQTTPVSRAAEAFRAMQQSRHVGKLVVTISDQAIAQAAIVPEAGPVARSGVTYLVTGGLGGFGLATAEWLVAEGATSLALASRRGAATEEAREAIARMESAGVSVRAFACDVSDAVQVAAMLSTIRSDMAPLKGVIHAAAAIEDAPLMNVTRDLLDRVMGAKVLGALHLDTLTRDDALELFVLYSSSSAVVGNPGQGAYVAANLMLDQLAALRRAMGLSALSVGWGAIKDAGFLTRNQHVEDMLAQRAGMEATPVRVALATLGKLIGAGAVKVAAAQFNLMRLGQSLPGARVPRFSELLPEGLMMTPEGAGSIAAALEAMPEEERRVLLTARIREHVARVIGSAAELIDPERSLSELGLDSLMAVELAEALEHDIGRPVSVMQMIQAGKVNGIVETVLRGLRGGKPGERAEQGAPAPSREAA